jgi:23S rRNA (guanosine2251-2'-O)-methyltransferase
VTTVVYGRNPVRELLAAGRRRVHELFALPELARERWLAEGGAQPRSRAELGRLCGSSDHQGVVAVCDPYPYADPWELVAATGPIVCLDGVQDPRNVGAVARVAEAAGAAGLVIPRRGSPGVTAAACKTSAGAVEHLSIAQVDSIASFVHDARGPGRWAVGAEAEGGEDYRGVAWDAGTILVMGAEGVGLRPRVRAVCDSIARIPLAGRVGSLNLSVAAGILLYEARRAIDAASAGGPPA